MKLKRPLRKHGRLMHLSKPGAAPGTLTAHPDLAEYGVTINVTTYDDDELIERDITDPNEILPYLAKYPVTWLNVYGVGDVKALETIAKIFNLHPLAMEDVVNIHQRPKVEEYGDITFAVTRMPELTNDEVILEQVSIFWGKNFVLTFLERKGDCLTPIHLRIEHGGKRQRLLHPEYLAYAILDTIIDSFFPILDKFGTRLDDMEEDAITNPSTQIIVNIHEFKRDLLSIRRAMWSQREAMRTLSESGNFIDPDMRFFIRDCEDHTIQSIEILESYRERVSGLMDIYLSSVSNKMNSIMKVLTIMATIFMPIGVIASIYGMNFDQSVSPWNMPELSWYYGYPFALGLIALTAIGFIVFFWRKGWLHQ